MNGLEEFDAGLKPASPGGRAAGLESIPDGDYEWTVLSAEYRTTKNGSRLVSMQVHNDQLGVTVERASFLGSQDNANALAADLGVLGFDTCNWKAENGRPFSKELLPALAKIACRRFKGTKKVSSSGGKTFHNLYVNAPLPAADPATLATTPATPAGATSYHASEIPF